MKQAWLVDPRYQDDLQKNLEMAYEKSAGFMDDNDPLNDFRFSVVNGNTAIVPVHGYISHRSSIWSWFFGGCSCESLALIIGKLIRIDKIKNIVLDINSPGGNVGGVEQIAEFIFQARQHKNIVAYVNTLAASAAYWIAAACSKVYSSENSSEAGSIGVILLHFSYQGLMEEEGIKATHIQSVKHKSIGSPYRDLEDDEKSILQADVDSIYSVFSGAINRYRGISIESITKMEGLTFMSGKSKELGLTDGKKTMNELIAEMEETDIVAQEEAADDDEENDDKDEEANDDEEAADDEEEKEASQEIIQKAIARGRALEIQRQKAIRSIIVPGMEKFMQKYIEDGKTSAEQAMVYQTRELKRQGGLKKLALENPEVKTKRFDDDGEQEDLSTFIPEDKKKCNWTPIGKALCKI